MPEFPFEPYLPEDQLGERVAAMLPPQQQSFGDQVVSGLRSAGGYVADIAAQPFRVARETAKLPGNILSGYGDALQRAKENRAAMAANRAQLERFYDEQIAAAQESGDTERLERYTLAKTSGDPSFATPTLAPKPYDDPYALAAARAGMQYEVARQGRIDQDRLVRRRQKDAREARREDREADPRRQEIARAVAIRERIRTMGPESVTPNDRAFLDEINRTGLIDQLVNRSLREVGAGGGLQLPGLSDPTAEKESPWWDFGGFFGGSKADEVRSRYGAR